MSSPVAELEAGLQAMLALKPPGVTGSRITSLTALCCANIQSESVLIQKLYTHFKKAPATHKLGVLYVVDAVVRKWTDLARSSGQDTSSNAEDGTYGAGVNKIRELLPVLMNDIITSAPKTQQEKISKLIEIWEKGQTFPAETLKSFKDKLSRSTTPEGSPPPEMRKFYVEAQAPIAPSSVAVTQNTSSILQALANIARQNTAAETVPSVPAVAYAPATAAAVTSYSVPRVSTGAQHAPMIPYTSQSQTANAPAPLAAAFGSLSQNNGLYTGISNQIPNQTAAPVISPPVALSPDLQRQFLMVKTLAEHGVPQAQWGDIIAALSVAAAGGNGNALNPGFVLPPPVPQSHYSAAVNHQAPWVPSGEQSRDRAGYGQRDSSFRQNSFGKRSRSRSPPPERGWKRESPISPNRGYENDFQDRGRGCMSQDYDSRGRNNNDANRSDYRQRSPLRGQNQRVSPPAPHWIQFDSAIPNDSLRVLSRTLFVGGVGCSEPELRCICAKFGKVQTCIVTKEKRHAFVKMINRKDAVLCKQGMEKMKGVESKFRSVRWGVGFGPRDCNDYNSGISIIPIAALTDADKKWLLTAEYGGTGGKPIQGTMVVEEPDIEVGQGVSSKAISRRLHDEPRNNKGPGPGSARGSQERDFGGYHNQDRRRSNDRSGHYRQGPSPNMSNPNMMPLPARGFPPMPPMPPMANGMPMFPPPLPIPGQAGQFLPPSGRN